MDNNKKDNVIKVEFKSISANESFARMVIAAFVSQLDPTLDELGDIKTAVSEAVTNAIIHGYGKDNEDSMVYMEAYRDNNQVTVIIKDNGKGIENIELARQPLYTSVPDMERSGMGFTVMETFMDSVEVISKSGEGTTVIMKKTFNTYN